MSAKISTNERDAIGNEFVTIAERIRKKHKLTIPEIGHEMHEILDVSVWTRSSDEHHS